MTTLYTEYLQSIAAAAALTAEAAAEGYVIDYIAPRLSDPAAVTVSILTDNGPITASGLMCRHLDNPGHFAFFNGDYASGDCIKYRGHFIDSDLDPRWADLLINVFTAEESY